MNNDNNTIKYHIKRKDGRFLNGSVWTFDESRALLLNKDKAVELASKYIGAKAIKLNT